MYAYTNSDFFTMGYLHIQYSQVFHCAISEMMAQQFQLHGLKKKTDNYGI